MLRIRRSITLEIDGPMDQVNVLATQLAAQLPDVTPESGTRFRIHFNIDLLDDNWNVIPAADVISRLR